MSLFTNDVDTISDAMNNSFAMIIQSFVQIAGTLTLLFVLNWRLSFLVILGYAAMFLYIRYSTKKSRFYYNRQQAYLGELDAYIEEMTAGQKVVKVFNHEKENLKTFTEKNRALMEAGTSAQSYAATMIPAVVSISYINYALIAVVGGIMVIAGLSDLEASPVTWYLSASPQCLSISSPSREISFWQLSPERSVFLTPWNRNRRRTKDPSNLSM